MEKILKINSKTYNIYNNFSKINIIFGPNSSGKSTIVNNLELIFSGKDKTSTINDQIIDKNSFNIIKIDSEFAISDLLKLTSKNVYKNKLKEIINSPELDLQKQYIEENLSKIQEILNSTINKDSILKWKIKEQETDDLLLNLIEGEINASKSEQNILFIKEKTNTIEKENIILIDDFDAFLNEDSILKILDILNSISATSFIFTNKPESLFYSYNKYSNYVCRNSKIIELNTLLSIENNNQNLTEYILNALYDQTKINSLNLEKHVYSIGRILVNQNINLVYKSEPLNNQINIYCSNENEYYIFSKIISSLKNY